MPRRVEDRRREPLHARDDAVAVPFRDQLQPVLHFEFLIDIVDVIPDRAIGNKELFFNVSVARSTRTTRTTVTTSSRATTRSQNRKGKLAAKTALIAGPKTTGEDDSDN